MYLGCPLAKAIFSGAVIWNMFNLVWKIMSYKDLKNLYSYKYLYSTKHYEKSFKIVLKTFKV